IIVSTRPAALLQTNGAPHFLPIAGTNLLYVSNSDDNIFLNVKDQQYYVLLSGRWYKAAQFKTGASWTYVPGNQLPQDFASIPKDNAKVDVLTSVPGTQEAQQAVIENQIPQTATVDRSQAKLEVTYDGKPVF